MSDITIKWNGEEAKVSVKQSFNDLYDVARLDFLSDAIFELQILYDKERSMFLKQRKQTRK